MDTLLILMIPLLGTTLGAGAVFFMKRTLRPTVDKLMTGFASGVMIAASIWSLILPSIEMSQGYALTFLPAAVGFSLGIGFLMLLDRLTPLFQKETIPAYTDTEKLKKTTKMVLAITLHNIPEGLAVGVIAAAAIRGESGVTMTCALILATGIAIQNFPEGAIVSIPLRVLGMKRGKAFLLGALSGVCEPIAGALTLLLTGAVSAALPYLLSFAAGAMFYVVTEELIPEANAGEEGSVATIGLTAGFLLMMILDVQFG
ncbi:MAG: ZIP family metal transporter [Ruminococcus sp.]|nr:ZIP family metal transporter [Ruminococcus sp.]